MNGVLPGIRRRLLSPPSRKEGTLHCTGVKSYSWREGHHRKQVYVLGRVGEAYRQGHTEGVAY